MTISRVPGYSLLSNLDRQGIDLEFTTQGNTLVYMDFANFNVGIKTDSPQESLEVLGNVLITQGNLLSSGNGVYNLGSATSQWNTVYANNVSAGNFTSEFITGTILTNAQPNITSVGTLGNLTVDTFINAGNVITANIIATEITSNSTVNAQSINSETVVTGNISGNLITSSQPYISTLSNITITQDLTVLGNTAVNELTANIIYENGNRVVTSNSNVIVTGDVYGYGNISNIALTLQDTGVIAGIYGSADDEYADRIPKITVDSKGRITNIANVTLTQVGNITFNDTTISANTDITITALNNGNITLSPEGTGIVIIDGDDAVRIPSGDNSTRPYDPEIGYIRYNTDIGDIEYWDGNSWKTPGLSTVDSQIITPDGVSDEYILAEEATAESVIVIINGTVQQPQTAYQVTGNAITFSETPLTSDIIEVRSIIGGIVAVQSLSYGETEVTLTQGNINVTGNILPSSNEIYDLGSTGLKWRDLYLSGNTIILGNSRISTNGSTLQFTAEGSETPINLGEGGTSGISPSAKWEEYSDLIINSTGASSTGSASTVIGGEFTSYASTAGSVTFTNGAAGHPGICALTTGAGTGTSVGIIKTSTPAASVAQIYIGAGELIYETLVNITALHDGSNAGFFRFGFMDEISGAPLNGIHAQCGTSADNWTLFCRANGASVSNAGTTTATIGWHHIKIIVNAAGTSASLYVDGNLEATVSSGLPSAGMSYGAQLQKTSGTTAISMEVDLFHVQQVFSTPRY